MSRLITSAGQITAEWLNQVWYENGIIDNGHIDKVQIYASYNTHPSTIIHLRVSYSDDKNSSAPTRLFVKLSRLEHLPADRREVDFYNNIARTMQYNPAVPCYEAFYDTNTGGYHLFLKDVSETHTTIPWPLSPKRPQAEQTIKKFADLHAHCWDDTRLGNDFGAWPDKALIRNPGNIESKFPKFVDVMDDRLSYKRRQIFEDVLVQWPELFLERTVAKRNLTLIHSEAHAWNILLPYHSEKDRVYIVDWQTYHPWIAAQDLAYYIILVWRAAPNDGAWYSAAVL